MVWRSKEYESEGQMNMNQEFKEYGSGGQKNMDLEAKGIWIWRKRIWAGDQMNMGIEVKEYGF